MPMQPNFSARTCAACATLFMLAACTGISQQSLSGPTAPAASNAASFLEPGAKRAALLYVSDGGGSKKVDIFSYPAGQLVGTLSGFDRPQGECVDAVGDVWITDEAASTLYEYGHGGKKPLAVRPDGSQYPIACAVDPTTGNLAVVNGFSMSGGGSVGIYTPQSGLPTLYTNAQLAQYSFVAYDADGDLFVDGEQSNGSFGLAELPKGSSAFTTITLNRRMEHPGALGWDGSHLVVGDADPFLTGLRMYRVLKGHVVGKTELVYGCGSIAVFFIEATRVAGLARSCSNMPIYNYPAGGSPVKRIKLTHVSAPAGIAVSE